MAKTDEGAKAASLAEVVEKLRIQLIQQERDAAHTICLLRGQLSDAYNDLAKFTASHARNLDARLKRDAQTP